ncbi:hypothetical protein ACFPPD_06225, partial [Cohnella suwonensis]
SDDALIIQKKGTAPSKIWRTVPFLQIRTFSVASTDSEEDYLIAISGLEGGEGLTLTPDSVRLRRLSTILVR